MRVIRDLNELAVPEAGSVVTIGNFDGVHRAHQQLMRRVVEVARSVGALGTAVTFEPHPARILAPARAPKLLTPLAQKIRLIEVLGLDCLIILPFTMDLARLSPQEFVHGVLAKRIRPRSVHIGPSFRFGHRQAGTPQLLEELARQEGFRVEVLPLVEVRGQRISSSRIRGLVSEGRVGLAARLLGRPHASWGAIVAGEGIGRHQTVPTLNLAPVEELLPRNGVYVTCTRLGETTHESITNVGHKPTFGEHRLTVESFLLNFSGEISAGEMEVQYLYRLRDEQKFPDAAALKAQIAHDAARARKYFRLLNALRRRRARSQPVERKA